MLIESAAPAARVGHERDLGRLGRHIGDGSDDEMAVCAAVAAHHRHHAVPPGAVITEVETENHDQPAGVDGEYVIRCGAAFLRKPLCRAHSQIVPKCGFVLGPRSLQEAPSRRQAVEAGRPQGTARARSRCGGAERNSRKREAAMAGSFLKVRDAPPCGYSGCSSRECTIPGGVVPAEWLRHAGLLVLKLPALPRPA